LRIERTIPRVRAALAAAAALLAAGCNLAEVTTEPGEDVVVVEAVLRTDQPRPAILLHRALQGRFAGPVTGASVSVTGDDGVRHVLAEAVGECYSVASAYAQSDSIQVDGTCYGSPLDDAGWVRPGGTYDLLVEIGDGRVIRGRTQVPADFAVPSLPAPRQGVRLCSLAPGTRFDLLWRRSENAASYVSEIRIHGLNGRLGSIGAPEPLELRGLAISDADTTIALPTEFGVFERFEHGADLLTAIQNGFPAGVAMELVLAAADRNWVNSVRGGNFNPSGLIRISTVVGDGVGVFGSLVVKHGSIQVAANTQVPRCGVR